MAHSNKGWLRSWSRAAQAVFNAHSFESGAKHLNGHRHVYIAVVVQVELAAFIVGIQDIYFDHSFPLSHHTLNTLCETSAAWNRPANAKEISATRFVSRPSRNARRLT